MGIGFQPERPLLVSVDPGARLDARHDGHRIDRRLVVAVRHGGDGRAYGRATPIQGAEPRWAEAKASSTMTCAT